MKVWIFFYSPVLRSGVLTRVWFHTVLQLHVVVAEQLMSLPYHMQKVSDSLQRSVEISV